MSATKGSTREQRVKGLRLIVGPDTEEARGLLRLGLTSIELTRSPVEAAAQHWKSWLLHPVEPVAECAEWDIQAIESEIERVAREEAGKVRPETIERLKGVVGELMALVVAAGIVLPAPRVDVNLEATIDLLWVDKGKKRLLAVTALQDDPAGRVLWVQSVDGGKSENMYDPERADLLTALKNYLG